MNWWKSAARRAYAAPRIASLLKKLERPLWPSLLVFPFAYGDNFGWGFLNYLASLPLGVTACALVVQSVGGSGNLTDGRRPRFGPTEWLLGLCSILVFLFHIQTFFLEVTLFLGGVERYMRDAVDRNG